MSKREAGDGPNTAGAMTVPVCRAFWRLALQVLASIAVFAADASRASAQAEPEPPPATPAEAALPDPLEVTTRLRTVVDSAVLAERQIANLANTDPLAADLEFARERLAELRPLVVGLGGAEFVRADRVARVRTRALMEDQRLALLDARASDRLAGLGEIRSEWAQRQEFWLRWRSVLGDDPEFALFEPEVTQALDRIAAVRSLLAANIPDVLAVQREIQVLRVETSQIAEQASVALAGRREGLLARDQPVLFSPAFLQQIQERPADGWTPATALRGAGYLSFVRDNVMLVALHLILVVFLGLIARQLRRRTALADGWSTILQHPWAAALFASTALVAQQYAFAPPLMEVVAWAVLAGAGVLLARRLVLSWPLRLMVFSFSGFYPLFLLAEAVWLPAPLFQLGLAAAATVGLVFFVGLMRRSARSEADPAHAPWIIAFGVLMWLAVLLAEVAGFHQLARWVIHASVTTALLLFVFGFLVVVARGLIWTLLKVQATGRFRVVHAVGVPIAERLLRLVQVVLVAVGVLALLNIWELTPAPLETWTLITGLGFTIAGAPITVGRLLFAVLLIYIAVTLSWIVRTFISAEVVPRWDLDRGVGDSIISVVHYLAIAVGILIALGALGVHLQNVAIVAGALSVGIGFGLQNIVNNFVSGIILLFERPVRVGDTVVIGGEWGTIRKIGLRSTRVETFDRSEMIVPNGDLVSEKVTNWTLSNPIARLTLQVGVAYGSPVRRVKQILRESAAAHPAVLDDPEPTVLFAGFGDSSLDFELRVWVRELRHRLDVKSMILEELDTRFRDEDIEIPFPQRDLHVRSLDAAIVDAVRRVLAESGQLRQAAGLDDE